MSMDKKQHTIFKHICNNNGIPKHNITFKRYRNLKEFKDFKLERINPNHIIKVMGKPKKKYIHDGCLNKYISVGEIIIHGAFIIFLRSEIFLFWINCFVLSMFCIHLCIYENPLTVLTKYVNWYRRRCRDGENPFISPLS